MKKKFSLLLLILTSVFLFVSCGGTKSSSSSSEQITSSSKESSTTSSTTVSSTTSSTTISSTTSNTTSSTTSSTTISSTTSSVTSSTTSSTSSIGSSTTQSSDIISSTTVSTTTGVSSITSSVVSSTETPSSTVSSTTSEISSSTESSASKLAAPVISKNGTQITWSSVTNSVGYIVYVNDTAEQVITTTSYDLKVAAGTYSYKVIAVASDTSLNSDYSNIINDTVTSKLSTPSVTISNGIASWDAVSNATGYRVILVSHAPITQTELSYTMPSDIGAYTIAVIAINSTNSNIYLDSDSGTAFYAVLGDPVIVKNSTGFSWSAVSNATSYDIYVNNSKVANQTSLSYDFSTNVGTTTYKIVAVATAPSVSSGYSNELSNTVTSKLATPVVTINSGIASWDVIPNADTYQLVVNSGVAFTQSGTSYTMPTTYGNQTISVKAMNSTNSSVYLDSDVCEISYYILEAPTISKNSTNIVWSDISGATGYIVYVNDILVSTQTESQYPLKTTAGVYKYKVIAKATAPSVNSGYSNEITDTVSVKLSTPVVSISSSVASWSAVTNAEKYEISIDSGVAFTQTGISYTMPTTSGTHTISVKAINETNSNIYLDSDSGTASYSIVAAPVISLDGFSITWSSITGATSYDIYVNNSKVANQTTTTYALAETVGTTTYKVMAMATAPSISSGYSNEISVTRSKLDSPSVTISNGIASWSAVTNATGYTVTINTSTPVTVTDTSYTIGTTTAGLFNIYVKAINSSSDYIASDSGEASFRVLAAPELVEGTSNITWVAVADVYKYDVYVNGELATENLVSTTISLAKMTSAGTYAVKVIAKADPSTNNINSGYSNEITYTITANLSQPVFTYDPDLEELSWVAISGATNYLVSVNGADAVSQTETTYALSKATNTTITVQAVNTVNPSVYLDSATSEFKIIVMVLDGKSFLNSKPTIYLDSTELEDGCCYIEWDTAVYFEDNFMLNINGTDIDEYSGCIDDYEFTTVGTYNILISRNTTSYYCYGTTTVEVLATSA